ncbi:MAG: hypothetical protein QNJ42_15580 [Crocosphaera sp.]|nr:hypothetical protein [Crocosphaera sp.]
MHFLINELSFIGQAEDIYQADQLIESLVKIIKEINEIKGSDPLQTHSTLSYQKISQDLTLKQWLHNNFKSLESKNQKIAQVLIRMLNKGPFVDVQGLLNTKPCYYNEKDVSNSSISSAVYLQGILISLQNSDNFTAEYITINIQNEPNENICIHNLTKIQQARKICPKYNPHPKHDSQSSWKNATPMNLNDDDAQKALNQSIKYKELQRYSYFDDKYYRFHSDNTFNNQGYPTYHGYPVDKSDVPNEVLKKLTR